MLIFCEFLRHTYIQLICKLHFIFNNQHWFQTWLWVVLLQQATDKKSLHISDIIPSLFALGISIALHNTNTTTLYIKTHAYMCSICTYTFSHPYGNIQYSSLCLSDRQSSLSVNSFVVSHFELHWNPFKGARGMKWNTWYRKARHKKRETELKIARQRNTLKLT